MLAALFRRTFAPLALAALLAALPLSASYTPQHGLDAGWQQAQAQAFTDFGEVSLTARLLRGEATPAFPATWYVALDTTPCSDSTPGTEVTGGSYARASFANNTTNWSASHATTGVSSNAQPINFATPTASWGTVQSWRLVDAVAAGNTWICANLTANQTISTGNTVSFATGAIVVTVQ